MNTGTILAPGGPILNADTETQGQVSSRGLPVTGQITTGNSWSLLETGGISQVLATAPPASAQPTVSNLNTSINSMQVLAAPSVTTRNADTESIGQVAPSDPTGPITDASLLNLSAIPISEITTPVVCETEVGNSYTLQPGCRFAWDANQPGVIPQVFSLENLLNDPAVNSRLERFLRASAQYGGRGSVLFKVNDQRYEVIKAHRLLSATPNVSLTNITRSQIRNILIVPKDHETRTYNRDYNDLIQHYAEDRWDDALATLHAPNLAPRSEGKISIQWRFKKVTGATQKSAYVFIAAPQLANNRVTLTFFHQEFRYAPKPYATSSEFRWTGIGPASQPLRTGIVAQSFGFNDPTSVVIPSDLSFCRIGTPSLPDSGRIAISCPARAQPANVWLNVVNQNAFQSNLVAYACEGGQTSPSTYFYDLSHARAVTVFKRPEIIPLDAGTIWGSTAGGYSPTSMKISTTTPSFPNGVFRNIMQPTIGINESSICN